MPVEAELSDAVALDALERAVAEACPQGELLQLREDLGLPASTQVDVLRAGKAGRPLGARNKRSESLAAQVERLFGNPVLRAITLAMQPVEELAAALGCSPLEAVQEQRLWLQLALPYVASRMPLSVDVTDRRMVSLTILTGAAPAADTPDAHVVEVLPYQSLSENADDAV